MDPAPCAHLAGTSPLLSAEPRSFTATWIGAIAQGQEHAAVVAIQRARHDLGVRPAGGDSKPSGALLNIALDNGPRHFDQATIQLPILPGDHLNPVSGCCRGGEGVVFGAAVSSAVNDSAQ